MGAEGQWILYDASSSRSRRGEDPRIAQMQREMEEQQRALDEQQRCLEEQRKKEEETRARIEAMKRILSTGIRNQPQPYVLHPEQTPQVPHMGGYFRSNSATRVAFIWFYSGYQFSQPVSNIWRQPRRWQSRRWQSRRRQSRWPSWRQPRR
ncbi:unnamed protein product [Cuscuta epithymum]|uniref:Uncharacterized protein n=1 Tax=Cuscuta epithymum TaxID=186058 RepID=A0AAV0CD35_9ASTE|nr:unnamed protein product [Cuscuta epithymum]